MLPSVQHLYQELLSVLHTVLHICMCPPKVLQVQNKLGLDASSFRTKFAGNVTAGQYMCCREDYTHWFSNFHSHYMKRDESYLVANCRDEIHLDKHNLIRDSQHGFRKGYSCTTNLLTFLENVTEEIKSNHSVDTIYLDLVKAFGKVPHQRLISKLKAHGVDGLVVSWIKAWLSDRWQRVCIDGTVAVRSYKGGESVFCH